LKTELRKLGSRRQTLHRLARWFNLCMANATLGTK